MSVSAGVQIALNSSLVTCFKCCGLGSDGPVTCLQAHQGCLLASSAEGQLVRFAQQPNSSIWVEDKRVCVTGRVNSLDAAEDASQAVVGSSMGTIWYGQATCPLVSTRLHYSAALNRHHPGVVSLTASLAKSADILYVKHNLTCQNGLPCIRAASMSAYHGLSAWVQDVLSTASS